MSAYFCMSVFLSLSLCLYLFISLSVFLCLCLSQSNSRSINQSVDHSISQTINQSVYCSPDIVLLAMLSHAFHYNDVIMNAMASQILSVSFICSAVCSGADQRKHQSLCEDNPPLLGTSPSQRASNAENVPIWCCQHDVTVYQMKKRHSADNARFAVNTLLTH